MRIRNPRRPLSGNVSGNGSSLTRVTKVGRGGRLVRTLCAGLALAGALVLASVTPAMAHDELISSDPADGENLVAAPETVTLEFSAEVLTVGAAVVVTDPAGTDWVRADPQVDGSVVIAALSPDMPNDAYELRWRVVSSDGHPISGIVLFTVGDVVPGEGMAAAKDDTADPADDTADPAEDPATNTTPSDSSTTTTDHGVLRTIVVGASGAVIAVALFALYEFRRRRTIGGDTGAVGEDPAVSSEHERTNR